MSAIAVCGTRNSGCRETVQVRKARGIRVDGEHRAVAETAAIVCRPIESESVARQNQAGARDSSVGTAEAMQVRKTGAVNVELEHSAITRVAAGSGRPIQCAA